VYAFEAALPGGGRVQARRRATRLPSGLTWVEEEMAVEGRLGGGFVTGPGWMLEWHRIEAGTVWFVQDGVRVRVEAARFGLLYAPFSITEVTFEDVRSRWVGLAGAGRLPGEREVRSVMFEAPPGEASTDAPQDAPALLAALEAIPEARSVERCTAPSPHARRAKEMLDASYRAATAIASVAARLGVSHPHLTRQFKRDFGMSPLAYRHALRAGEATARLSEGERIVDVSGDVGYDDLGRFYKAFRRVMNASPGQCRP
jgi:AraC-like DNA-binding protein